MSTADELQALADAAEALGRLARAVAERAASPTPTDELVRLAELPFDVEARRRLVREGHLRVVRIGRHIYTSRAAVAALATSLPPAAMPGPRARAPEVPGDDLAAAARARAARRAR